MGNNIGKKIMLIRQARQVSQLDLSKMVGIDNSRLSLIENGHVDPTPDQLDKIRTALNWTPELDQHLEALAAAR